MCGKDYKKLEKYVWKKKIVQRKKRNRRKKETNKLKSVAEVSKYTQEEENFE